jgi:hypothetical protein
MTAGSPDSARKNVHIDAEEKDGVRSRAQGRRWQETTGGVALPAGLPSKTTAACRLMSWAIFLFFALSAEGPPSFPPSLNRP